MVPTELLVKVAVCEAELVSTVVVGNVTGAGVTVEA